ncbi:uncharacterized protein LOC122458284 isoform X4 [Dermochelys coriacea]|uniref:uncharacterized protein LOC122458284 isoform X4 n=2 Tax=Dermochelys coriacea TaxID=27794 RepID=UPI001CA7C4EB|nr:uncharacterized protein LOC122458284 isoform X4 [Dermochelys coriacea]
MVRMRFREPPPPGQRARAQRAPQAVSPPPPPRSYWRLGPPRATRRHASPAPPFPAHRCSACALDQLFPSCPGCYKFSLPRLCRSFLSERALQAAHACPQALQAAHACPQASGAMLHQLKRAVTICEDMVDTSPLKLRLKKKRLSTNFEKCVVCQENQKNAKLSKATSAGQNSVMLAAEARRDELYWRLLGEFSSLDAVPPILYHRGCFQKYTSKSNLAHVRVMLNPGRKTNSESDQRAACSSESVATGLSTSSSDWSCCIVCLRKTHKKDKKLHRIVTSERAANLWEAAVQRGDADMMCRVSVEDLIAKEAVYHSTCISSYLSKTNLKAKQSSCTATIQSPYDVAFYQLIKEIDNDLMDNKKALLLSKLLQRYKALLPSEIETASYSSSKLQARLVKHYGSAISFHAQHGQGKSTIVLCSTITLADAIQASSNLKQALKSSKCFLDGLPVSEADHRLSNEQVVLYNAASILRSEIAKVKASEYYPKTGDCNFQRPATFVPQLVQEFVLRLIDKEAHNSVSNEYLPPEDIQRRCRSIAECIVFNSNPCTLHRDHNGEQDSDVD